MKEYIMEVADTGMVSKVGQEIVRCKECIHKNGLNHCPHNNDIWVADNWYCADGERKEER